MLRSFRSPFRAFSLASQRRLKAQHRRATTAAEVLEDRTLLSATFATNGTIALTVGNSPVGEKIAVGESGSAYVFTLNVGTWSGTDGAGVSGSGSKTLFVQKGFAAGKTGGLELSSDSNVELATANFSTLSKLNIQASDIIQAAGETLVVSTASISGSGNVTFSGNIIGGAGRIVLTASMGLELKDASVVTTSGEIALSGGTGLYGNFVGTLIRNSVITTQTGAIRIISTGGTVQGTTPDGAVNHGVWISDSAISSTGEANLVLISGTSGSGLTTEAVKIVRSSVVTTSAAITIGGFVNMLFPPLGAVGVSLLDTNLQAVTGYIAVHGGSGRSQQQSQGIGLSITGDTRITSTGTGANAAQIVLSGSASHSLGYGILIAAIDSGGPRPVVRSSSGDIIIRGTGGAIGVSLFEGVVTSTGSGAGAANISITGEGSERGVDVRRERFRTTDALAISTIDGDVHIVGTSFSSSAVAKLTGADTGPTFGVGLNGRIKSLGDGNITIAARQNVLAGGNGSATTSAFLQDSPDVNVDSLGASIGVYALGSGSVIILADSMTINDGRLWSENGIVLLAPVIATREVQLGGAANSAVLHLADHELDRVYTQVLQIGRTEHTAGVSVRGLISQPTSGGYGTLAIVTAGYLADRDIVEPSPTGRLRVDRLVAQADGILLQNAAVSRLSAKATGTWFYGITVTNAVDLTLGHLSAERIEIDVTGTVTIAPNATLETSRFVFTATPYYPDPPREPLAQIPLVIRNDGNDPITGTFVGLPEGALIATVGNHPVHITYQANKPDGSNDALIELHVQPFPRDDQFEVAENKTLTGNVLANDVDYGNGPLTVTQVYANGNSSAIGQNIVLSSGASLWVDPDGYFYYTPGDAFEHLATGEEAVDGFVYEVTDAYGGKWTARVRITVVGAGTEDLIGFNAGGWYVGVSDGDSFNTSSWAGWSDADWDAMRHGDFNGDGRTDVLGLLDGFWYVGISTGSSFTTSLWTRWTNVAWQDVIVADLDRDGNDDILARVGGNWWASLSEGSSFRTATLWAAWSDLPWDFFSVGTASSAAFAPGTPTLFGFIDGEWWAAQTATSNDGFILPAKWATLPNADYDEVQLLDFDGDHGSDFAVLFDGVWTIGSQSSYWGPFETSHDITWANIDWQDVRIGDFDGDGRDDIAGRAAGEWWVARFDGDRFTTTLWATWSDLDWQDVTVGDFSGDGRDDIAGRFAGEWWVGISHGTEFWTRRWDTWTEGGWEVVFAGDVSLSPPPFVVTTSGMISQPFLVDEQGSSDPAVEDVSDPEICEDYPWLDGHEPTTEVAEQDQEEPIEICLDYPYLDGDETYALLDELLTAV